MLKRIQGRAPATKPETKQAAMRADFAISVRLAATHRQAGSGTASVRKQVQNPSLAASPKKKTVQGLSPRRTIRAESQSAAELKSIVAAYEMGREVQKRYAGDGMAKKTAARSAGAGSRVSRANSAKKRSASELASTGP